MKTRHALVIYIFGILLSFPGAGMKILHYPGASELLTAATVFQVAGELLFIYKLWTNPKAKEFLDW